MCGVEELKWDVCSQQGQRLALDSKESKCGGVSGQSASGKNTRHGHGHGHARAQRTCDFTR
jgi:hypothetical protein